MILPQMADVVSGQTEAELPLLYEYAYDFDTGDFKLKDGKHYLVSGPEALKIWIWKALRTRRFFCAGYSTDYGSELDSLIGLVISDSERKSEIKRMIIECLLVNPYILSVDNIDFDQKGSELIVNIKLSTEYGEVNETWTQTQ